MGTSVTCPSYIPVKKQAEVRSCICSQHHYEELCDSTQDLQGYTDLLVSATVKYFCRGPFCPSVRQLEFVIVSGINAPFSRNRQQLLDRCVPRKFALAP